MAYSITLGVLRQKGRMTKPLVREHANGTLELPWSNINLKGIPNWRTGITSEFRNILLSDIHCSNVPNVLHVNSAPVIDHERFHTMACPKCASNRDVTNCSLLVRSGWGHILCFACRITSRSKTWRCLCGIPWHTCTVHSSIVRSFKADEDMPWEPLTDFDA